MQERRTTIRVPHSCRILYCASEDLLLRDGSLLNVSERGAELLVRETHRDGDQVTVSFDLPGHAEPVTATGVVRWSRQRPINRRWHAAGVEWLPLEEVLRERFHQFSQRSSSTLTPSQARTASSLKDTALITWGISGLLAIFVLVGSVSSLRKENGELMETVEQRTTLVRQLSRDGDRLKRELGATKTALSETAMEVVHLNDQAQQLGQQVGQLTQDIQRFERSYTNVYEDRQQLMQRVLDLEQERASLSKRFSTVEGLQTALREAVQARRRLRKTQHRLFRQARRTVTEDRLLTGNQGFLLRNGQWVKDESVPTQSSIHIRVHDPETLPTEIAPR